MIRYFAYCQGDILLTTEGNIPFGLEPPVMLKEWNYVTTLNAGDIEIKVIRLDNSVIGEEGLQMMPLRKTFHILSAEDYQLAGKCAELVYFHQNNRFCGVCGGEMRWQTEISKQCKECGKELWPSLATAIIVRVRRGDEILMVHAHTFRDRHYGLVAGFVETGETLEECVQREVWEETHLRITNIRYFASQPWPYPSGLMIGFTADYLSGELQLQKAELSDGGWYSKDNLPYLPDPSSIAYRLIMDWVNSKFRCKIHKKRQ
ncbi:MAG: NAD(+) diphosphatase [Bacteroidaceae bacterium]|nr:NAD(+) diphosphatase [Bacteroidaceae bacterium]